jgi:hypothetical protein
MSHSSDPASSNENPPPNDDTSDVHIAQITEDMLREGLIHSVSAALGRGPNDGPLGFNKEGQLVERVPNEEYYVDEDGQPAEEDSLPYDELPVLRSLDEIGEAYEHHWNQISWYRNHKRWTGKSTDPDFQRIKAWYQAIAKLHGGRAKLLARSDFEVGTIYGRMQAFAWLYGMEWEHSGDT